MPTLTFELRGDVAAVGGRRDSSADLNHLVRLECQDFAISFENGSSNSGDEGGSGTMEIALRSLTMEDLQLPKEDKHRLLMTSMSDGGAGR